MEIMKLSEHADEEGDYSSEEDCPFRHTGFALNQCYRLFLLSAFGYKDY